MKAYGKMSIEELRTAYQEAPTELHKGIIAKIGKYKKYEAMSVEALRIEYVKASEEDKKVIEQLGKHKKNERQL